MRNSKPDGGFVLEIALGNATMGRPEHIAAALRKLAYALDGGGDDTEGTILDENGNRVGGWKVSPKWEPAEGEIECDHCGQNAREKDTIADPDKPRLRYCPCCAEQLRID